MPGYDDLPRIAHVVDDYTVVLNVGAANGIEIGQTFLIFGLGAEIQDPTTKESLGRLELVRGRGRVKHLQDRLCTITSIETFATDRGRKVIKRQGGFSVLGMGTEEIIENPSTEQKEFNAPEIGDYAKKI